MLVAAAVCPPAPVLVPDLAHGAADELDPCRRACAGALEVVLSAGAERLAVVGAGPVTATHRPGSTGSLRPFGVDVRAALPSGRAPSPAAPDAPAATLPPSLTLGAWLLERQGWTGPAEGLEVAADEAPAACRALGEARAGGPGTVALLVMADGTARRGPRAPGYTDDRSAGVDEAWVSALRTGTATGLLALEAHVCRALMMSGRAALQVLAGAAGDGRYAAEVSYADDPYGVQYAVATWVRA